MPVTFGTSVTSVSYIASTGVLAVNGTAFADTVYAGVSNIEASVHGSGSWTAVNSIGSWSDTQVSGTFNGGLSAGTYDIRVTSSDGETSTLENALVVVPSALVTSGFSYFLYGYRK